MLKLKSCPKCKKGDVTLDRDYYGWYEYCIQCGYVHDLENMVEIQQQSLKRERRRKGESQLKQMKVASDGC